MSEPTGEWTPENICEATGFVSQVEPDFYTSLGELIRRICDARNAALAAEREKVEKWRIEAQAIANEVNALHKQLAAEREKVALLGESRIAVDQAELLALREKASDLEQQLAAEQEKNECTCDIDTICRVHGCPKCYDYQKQLAAERERYAKLLHDWEQLEKQNLELVNKLAAERKRLVDVTTVLQNYENEIAAFGREKSDLIFRIKDLEKQLAAARQEGIDWADKQYYGISGHQRIRDLEQQLAAERESRQDYQGEAYRLNAELAAERKNWRIK